MARESEKATNPGRENTLRDREIQNAKIREILRRYGASTVLTIDRPGSPGSPPVYRMPQGMSPEAWDALNQEIALEVGQRLDGKPIDRKALGSSSFFDDPEFQAGSQAAQSGQPTPTPARAQSGSDDTERSSPRMGFTPEERGFVRLPDGSYRQGSAIGGIPPLAVQRALNAGSAEGGRNPVRRYQGDIVMPDKRFDAQPQETMRFAQGMEGRRRVGLGPGVNSRLPRDSAMVADRSLFDVSEVYRGNYYQSPDGTFTAITPDGFVRGFQSEAEASRHSQQAFAQSLQQPQQPEAAAPSPADQPKPAGILFGPEGRKEAERFQFDVERFSSLPPEARESVLDHRAASRQQRAADRIVFDPEPESGKKSRRQRMVEAMLAPEMFQPAQLQTGPSFDDVESDARRRRRRSSQRPLIPETIGF